MKKSQLRKIIKEELQKLNEANTRSILPSMVKVSNNSRITQSVANSIIEKFDTAELNDFKVWLQLISRKIEIEKEHAKKWLK